MPALLALLSAAVWGVADFTGGLASRRSTPLRTLALTTPAGLVVVLPVALLVGGSVSGSVLPGVVSGVTGSLGILLLYAALTLGPMGVVSPVSAVLGAAIPVLVGLVHGERPGAAAYVGMALAVVAIVTVGLEPPAPTDDARHQRLTPRALLLAVGAGVGIGVFFAVIAQAPSDAGLWPVVFSRAVSTVLLALMGLVVVARRGGPFLPAGRTVRIQAIAAGTLDVGANALYLVATQTGLLSVVAVLGSLYPAATVLLARYVLAERLHPLQKVGMATAIVAGALLALG
ncbi:MAG: EamA family transporter [Frankiales bacterium]|nr:EamA family transporter [Frankiales bacterium]